MNFVNELWEILRDFLEQFGHTKWLCAWWFWSWISPYLAVWLIIARIFKTLDKSSRRTPFGWNQKLLYSFTYTVLPRLVRMRTNKLMSFSGFVLSERAYYPRGRTIELFTSWPISQIYFSKFLNKKILWFRPISWISWHIWAGKPCFGIAVTMIVSLPTQKH